MTITTPVTAVAMRAARLGGKYARRKRQNVRRQTVYVHGAECPALHNSTLTFTDTFE